MIRSRYDELHDRFDPIKTGKAGTRYERLAAKVLKALNSQDVVIHDMKLLGDSTVPHQIDVKIVRNGIDHHVIAECKDFDRRGAKVGLDIVRSFRSVVEDTNADEAIIITCIGFTQGARKFAVAKGIKLVVLRSFETEDMDGRIQAITIKMHIRGVVNLDVEGLEFDEPNRALFNAQMTNAGLQSGITLASPIYFIKGRDCVQFNDFLSRAANEDFTAGNKPEDEYSMRLQADGWRLSIAEGTPIDFDHIDLRYFGADSTEVNTITSDRVAELILTDFTNTDIIIYADQLERHKISPNGDVLKDAP